MHAIESFVLNLAHSLPLEIFVTLGSFLEEVIAPIPSPSIMVIAGSFASVQHYSHYELALLVVFASIGKTLGGVTMYYIAHHARDIAFRFFGRFIDITEEDTRRFGERFTGTPHDYGVYIFLRAVPIIPSILLSFGSGVVKLPLRLFIIGTFVGTLIRDTFYLLVGYSGAAFLARSLAHSNTLESLTEYIVFSAIGISILYLVYRRHKKRMRD